MILTSSCGPQKLGEQWSDCSRPGRGDDGNMCAIDVNSTHCIPPFGTSREEKEKAREGGREAERKTE